MRRSTLTLSLAATAVAAVMVAAPASAAGGQVIAGVDRYETASLISQQLRTDATGANTVLLVTGENFPDAVSAAAAAESATGGRVLLTGKDSLPASTIAELQRLAESGNAPRVVVIGGETTISNAVYDQVANYSSDIMRLAGSDRYETSALIAEEFANGPTSIPGKAPSAFIATGTNYPDALAGAAIAGNAPMLLTSKDALPASIAQSLTSGGISNIRNFYVLGNTTAVSDAVVSQIKQIHPDARITRLGGDDRFDTAAKIADYFLGTRDVTDTSAVLATGNNFPDALASSVLAFQESVPLLLTADNVMPTSTRTYLVTHDLNSAAKTTLIGKVNPSVFN